MFVLLFKINKKILILNISSAKRMKNKLNVYAVTFELKSK